MKDIKVLIRKRKKTTIWYEGCKNLPEDEKQKLVEYRKNIAK